MKASVKTEAEADMLYEAFMLDGAMHYSAGYEIAWRVRDKASRLEVATIAWHKGAFSQGCSYTPNNANLAKLRETKSQ